MCFIMMETLVCPPGGQGTPLHLPEPPSSLSSMSLPPPPRVALPSSQRGFTSVISFTCASVSQRGLWEPAGHRFTDSC